MMQNAGGTAVSRSGNGKDVYRVVFFSGNKRGHADLLPQKNESVLFHSVQRIRNILCG